MQFPIKLILRVIREQFQRYKFLSGVFIDVSLNTNKYHLYVQLHGLLLHYY